MVRTGFDYFFILLQEYYTWYFDYHLLCANFFFLKINIVFQLFVFNQTRNFTELKSVYFYIEFIYLFIIFIYLNLFRLAN